MRRKYFGLSLISLLTFSLIAGGCIPKGVSERAMEDQIEKQTGGQADVDIDGDQMEMKVKTDDGTFEMGKDVKLPENVPQYPGSQIISKAAGTSADGQGGLFTMTSSDGTEEIVKYYQDYYTGQGWEQVAEMNFGQATTVVFEKGEDNNISVSVAQNNTDSNATINVVVSQQN